MRFTDEVSGEGSLNVIYRGDRSEIALFPGKNLDNPLSLNTVDICPVGALVSSDFLFQSRVWNLHSGPSVCSDCAVGCNSRVDLDAKDHIKRIVPRQNEAVNKSWMCDSGRLSFDYTRENRLQKPKLHGKDATLAGSPPLRYWICCPLPVPRPLSRPGTRMKPCSPSGISSEAEFSSIRIFGYGNPWWPIKSSRASPSAETRIPTAPG